MRFPTRRITALHAKAKRAMQEANDALTTPMRTTEAAFVANRRSLRAQRTALDAMLAANHLAREFLKAAKAKRR